MNIALEQMIVIDIETVSEKPDFCSLDEEWKALWKEKIAKQLPDNITSEDFYPKRAAIFAEFGKVICISMGLFSRQGDEAGLRMKSIYGHNERNLLIEFANILTALPKRNLPWVFVGHNVREFDIPYLCRRMLVHGIPIPRILNFQHLKPWETPVLDTLQLWKFGDYKHYISLRLLAKVLGIPSPKDDIDGSQVGDVYWIDGDPERICIYCEKDVITAGNIIMRFYGRDLVKEYLIEHSRLFIDE